LNFNMLAMEQDVVPEISPAKEFLPLLEEKLKKLLDQRDQLSEEIDDTSKMIDELKVKLAGGELPLPIGQSVHQAESTEFLEQISRFGV
jgi:hypothetical protein